MRQKQKVVFVSFCPMVLGQNETAMLYWQLSEKYIVNLYQKLILTTNYQKMYIRRASHDSIDN